MKEQKAREDEVLKFKNIYPVAPFDICEDSNPIARGNGQQVSKPGVNSACGQFCNRMLICMFAICLIWLTSLQVCVSIVGFNISIPSFSVVVANCNYAYAEVKSQRDSYTNCARRQMKRCEQSLDVVYAGEKMSVAHSQRQNQQYANQFQSLVGNCSTAVSLLKGSVAAWSSQGVQYTIPYHTNCTGTKRSAAVTVLGDNSNSRTSVYSATQAYTVSSDNTVVRLAEYSVALNAYNAEYVHNKTQRLRQLAQSIVTDISVPHIVTISASFEPVFDVLDQVLACTSLANRTSLVCKHQLPTTLLDAFEYRQYIIARTIRDLRSAFLRAQDNFHSLADAVMSAVLAANQFYDSVVGPMGVIQWVRDNTAGLGNLCGKSTPNYCSFTKDSWLVSVPAFPYLPYVTFPVEAKELWEAVSDIEVAERAKVVTMAKQVRSELQQWMDEVQAAIEVNVDFTPEDYNPPSYESAAGHNATTEAALQTKRSSAFIDNVETIMSTQNLTQISSDNFIRLVNTTHYLNLAQGALSDFASSWASFSGADIDFTVLIQSVLTAQSILFLFDYIYRIYQTVRLISRFWRRGVAGLPKVDLRSSKPDIPDAWFVCMARFFDWLPFFSLQLLWLTALVVLIVWGFAAVFIPQYISYVGSCVDHSQNHTFISRNLYAAAYNYASSDGSGLISRGLGEYNIQSAEYCTASGASSVHTYTGLLNQLYAANQTLVTERRDLQSITGCIDMPVLDSAFTAACCRESSAYSAVMYGGLGANNGGAQLGQQSECTVSAMKCPMNVDAAVPSAYLPPGFYAASASCSADGILSENITSGEISNAVGTVQRSTFDCQALPKCEITCTLPDSETILLWSKHCSCMAEWYLNGAVVQTLVALLAYMLINTSRIMMTKGVVKILWRELTPQIFEYTASCDGSGNIMNSALPHLSPHSHSHCDVEASVTEKGHSNKDGGFQEALQNSIAKSITAHERSGRVLIVAALLINAPWIVVVAVVKNNIEYTPLHS